MCGIFAYSGDRSVPDVLIEGLKKLEYRGYDSSGIAFFHEDHVEKFRVCGDVSQLEKEISKENYGKGIGIGHTRWATHGSPSEKNAHPHQSSSIYIVHNGVIENEHELRKRIDPKSLSSDTDTEIIAHLISEEYKKQKDLMKSVLKVTSLLEGSYAVVVLCEDNPEEFIAFKKGPPLMFCKGRKGDYFISSDPHVSSEYSDQVLFLEDEQILHFKKKSYEVYDFKGKKSKTNFETVSYNPGLAEKKGYPHFMLKEIFEQPSSLNRLIGVHTNKDNHLLDFKISKGNQKDFDSLFVKNSQMLIVACGSSYFAGLYAKYFIESIVPMKVDVEMASEFIYRKSFIPKGTPVLFISQSGETADILKAFNQIEEKKLEAFCLCNVKGSTLDRLTKYSIYMEAGVEIGVASTKTFSSSLMALSLLGMHISKIKKHISLDEEKDLVKNLVSFPSYVNEVLKCDKFFLETADIFKKFSGFFYLGRGLCYPIALEGALKLKEIAYLHAEAYPSGEMKHGPLAMISENMVVIVLLPLDPVLYEKTITNLKEVKARGAFIVGLGGSKKEELNSLCDYYLELPQIHSFFHSLLMLVPLQMMAYSISRSYGYDADRPRNLAKSVTVE